MPNADRIVFYTFAAVIIFLALTNWRGLNEVLKTGFGGYIGAVTALQGRRR